MNRILVVSWLCLSLGLAHALPAWAAEDRAPGEWRPQGLVFDCPAPRAETLRYAMSALLIELDIDRDWIVRTDLPDGRIAYTLDTPADDTDTLALSRNPRYRIRDEIVRQPARERRVTRVQTVSRKEILLAMLQVGRATTLSGAACDLRALREHLGLRQNIVAWLERRNWQFPDGEPARWNADQWRDGTPLALSHTELALRDAFTNEGRYAFGCYTASKISFAHGVLDYYRRVLKDPVKAGLALGRLLRDREPLVDIEPPQAWSFEADFDPGAGLRSGKLLGLIRGIPPRNFIPGDWAYLINDDPGSRLRSGYEGSNAIYLGRGRFADFYAENPEGYSFEAKLDEVWQWRNGVFSRSRDAARIQPLGPRDYERLSARPEEGGLLHDLRMTPYFFGWQALPYP